MERREYNDVESEFAEVICRTLATNGVETSEEYIAAAGIDYGHVKAWELSDGRYAIAYGDNGHTSYDIDDNADDLAAWLESPDVYGFDLALQTANVRGVDALPELDESSDTFRVLCTRRFYGPASVSSWETDANGNELEFDSLADAKAYVDEQDGEMYVTDNNESGRPDYTIVGA